MYRMYGIAQGGKDAGANMYRMSRYHGWQRATNVQGWKCSRLPVIFFSQRRRGKASNICFSQRTLRLCEKKLYYLFRMIAMVIFEYSTLVGIQH